jgi:hypothetical protein
MIVTTRKSIARASHDRSLKQTERYSAQLGAKSIAKSIQAKPIAKPIADA